ncbi:hypothetical protein QE152_g39533 [Popillia japonica]|uniref:Nucleic-acid-binding protein from transposon X-element n=1 Tax=Popillia japonica TaxID=7064 RepID=A0AAW1HTU2_POPJA
MGKIHGAEESNVRPDASSGDIVSVNLQQAEHMLNMDTQTLQEPQGSRQHASQEEEQTVESKRRKLGLADYFNIEITNRYADNASNMEHEDIESGQDDGAESQHGILADNASNMEHEDIESGQDDGAESQQWEEQTREEQPRNNQKPPPICFVTRLKKCYGEFRSKLDAISADYYLHLPPPICFVTRLKKCYGEFRSKLDAISADYYLHFAGDKTLGLHDDVEAEDVKLELLELEVPVKSVEKFKNTKNPIFMLTVPKNVGIKQLSTKARYVQRTKTKARYVQRTKVYYEPHMSKRELIQCKKCQEWGHATANCFLGVVRCVKCAGSHRSYECSKSRTEPATCCNCGGDHPASSLECDSYIKAVETKKRKNDRAAISAQTRKPKYQPAPPPKTNAWQSRGNFPPLPTPRMLREVEPRDGAELQRRSSLDDATTRQSQSQNTQSGGHTPPDLSERTGKHTQPPTNRMNRTKELRSTREYTDIDDNLNYTNRIADTFKAINDIVNLEWLADRLDELYEKMKSCTTLIQHAKLISEFNEQHAP